MFNLTIGTFVGALALIGYALATGDWRSFWFLPLAGSGGALVVATFLAVARPKGCETPSDDEIAEFVRSEAVRAALSA